MVAAEVKLLANSTESSLSNIEQLTVHMRQGVVDAVTCMELVAAAARRVGSGADSVSAMGEELRRLGDSATG